MTHADLVERAVRWLGLTRKCSVIVHEMATLAPVVPDAIGWRRGGAESILVECKVSRADFARDRRKTPCALGQERWYMTPEGLLSSSDLPDGWGLAEVTASGCVRVILRPKQRVGVDADVARNELPLLVSALRRALRGSGLEPLRAHVALGDDEKDGYP